MPWSVTDTMSSTLGGASVEPSGSFRSGDLGSIRTGALGAGFPADGGGLGAATAGPARAVPAASTSTSEAAAADVAAARRELAGVTGHPSEIEILAGGMVGSSNSTSVVVSGGEGNWAKKGRVSLGWMPTRPIVHRQRPSVSRRT